MRTRTTSRDATATGERNSKHGRRPHGHGIMIEESVVIRRPVQEVFGAVSDFRSAAQWREGVRATRREPPGPMAVGSRLYEEASILGRPVVTETVVQELEPGRRRTFRHASGPIPVAGGFTVTARWHHAALPLVPDTSTTPGCARPRELRRAHDAGEVHAADSNPRSRQAMRVRDPARCECVPVSWLWDTTARPAPPLAAALVAPSRMSGPPPRAAARLQS